MFVFTKIGRVAWRHPTLTLVYVLVALVLLWSPLLPSMFAVTSSHNPHVMHVQGSGNVVRHPNFALTDDETNQNKARKDADDDDANNNDDGNDDDDDGEGWYRAADCSLLQVLAGPDPTALKAYDRRLVCGQQVRHKDVVCSLFYSQVGLLEDDDDCVRTTDDRYVPRVIYYVIFGETYVFKFWHYVSMMAAKRHMQRAALYVVGDALPIGYWWARVMNDIKGVRFLYRALLPSIGGKPVEWKHHVADVVRLQLLLLNGGIYLDTDMVLTRPLDPLLQYDVTMGLIDNGTGMGNAFIAARRNSDFIRDWYENYNNYTKEEFYTNSLHVPRDLWRANASRLHVDSARLYRPNWFEADRLFKRDDYDWSENYAVHVWTNGNPVPKDEQEIQSGNTTIKQIFRLALYGDPKPRL